MSRLSAGLKICLPFAALTLAACATAPVKKDAGAPFSAPTLDLCPGTSISNAPAASSTRRIIGYHPFTLVRGVTLSRAPVNACVSSAFGPRSGGAGSFHDGIDLYTRTPSTVYAGGAGRIRFVGTQRGYGLTIEIAHKNGVVTRYAHLSAAAPGLRAGAAVGAGQVIGKTGRSGNATAVHLHYEILTDGRPNDPLRIGD
ncbi:MAG: M23 family metallopeptidase [Parvularculaceae bacterium]|nr:M23 family metallopeptidase [Parvularculaceae bacterium]